MTKLRVVNGGAPLPPFELGTGLSANAVGKVYKKRPVVRNVSISVRRG